MKGFRYADQRLKVRISGIFLTDREIYDGGFSIRWDKEYLGIFALILYWE